ncbi:VCBS repeat-containing protein [Rubrivirga sp.]|uniref:VCBS repeat-containing protein n=1 Tax=Rubrivirga sp. TaxID=1885344 RepID=UPI003B51D147
MAALAVVVGALAGCGGQDEEAPLFTLVPAEESGLDFVNALVESDSANVLAYEYFYNGGGVAIGDVDGDDRPDVFLTANQGPNRLYRNATEPGGPLRFEDVTEAAGVDGPDGWTTGATFADVDGDGDLDLYVARSGKGAPDARRNLLYVNDGAGRFDEQAAAFGLDDPSYSTHASFFDADRDGDLDVYLVNHNVERLSGFDVAAIRAQRHPYAGDKLYRNDGGRFTDVSDPAGIKGNPIGFGLSATVADIDGDGWPDLYVANDYDEDDYLYLNDGDGTFTDQSDQWLAHTSYFSMGTDIADVNNDALPDVVSLDMLPPDNRRQKLLKGPENYDRTQLLLSYGYRPQHMRNMLQLNTGAGAFAEIGQVAGISNTDWSWSALLADFDLDGLKDLVVTNGYVRDYTNLDFLKFTAPEAARAAQARGEKPDLLALVNEMPSSDLSNAAFRNRGDLRFDRVTEAWGLERPSLSNGAATGDLDGDGDLDLVVNNIDAPAFLYENHADRLGHHFLRVALDGDGGNRFGLGARVEVRADGATLVQEQNPARGYQSSVDPVLVFGLGDAAAVDVTVTWPDGRRQTLANVAADQTLTLRQAQATDALTEAEAPDVRFVFVEDGLGLEFRHQENPFVDFKREPLLPHMLSRMGPALATGDVNGDGLADVFVGGARGQAPALYLQQPDARFTVAEADALVADAEYEDVDAAFFDADGDRDLDLYVVSGDSEAPEGDALYQDRLYLNSGFGLFERATGRLPEIRSSGGTVAAGDADGDGDLDLFVGGRVTPGRYPLAPRSYLLQNDGAGRFSDATPDALQSPGLVADAEWADLDGDGSPELILAGEWMPVRVFRRDGDGYAEITDDLGLAETSGWWHVVRPADLDDDGDLDLVAGNRGLNSQIQARPGQPATIRAADLDGNGSLDAVLGYVIDGRRVPAVGRDEMLGQVNVFKRRFTDYASYAEASFDDLFSRDQRRDAVELDAETFETTVFENVDGRFVARPLPTEAQVAPTRDVLVADLDRDGTTDLLLAGNDFGARAQDGRYDAGRGLFLRGAGGLDFDAVGPAASGFYAPGDVRRLALVPTSRGTVVVVASNDGGLTVFGVR